MSQININNNEVVPIQALSVFETNTIDVLVTNTNGFYKKLQYYGVLSANRSAVIKGLSAFYDISNTVVFDKVLRFYGALRKHYINQGINALDIDNYCLSLLSVLRLKENNDWGVESLQKVQKKTITAYYCKFCDLQGLFWNVQPGAAQSYPISNGGTNLLGLFTSYYAIGNVVLIAPYRMVLKRLEAIKYGSRTNFEIGIVKGKINSQNAFLNCVIVLNVSVLDINFSYLNTDINPIVIEKGECLLLSQRNTTNLTSSYTQNAFTIEFEEI